MKFKIKEDEKFSSMRCEKAKPDEIIYDFKSIYFKVIWNIFNFSIIQ